jgi:hypothetical protein
MFMAVWVLNHFTTIDFRPFKVGNNIQKRNGIPEGAPKPSYYDFIVYKVNGVDTRVLRR